MPMLEFTVLFALLHNLFRRLLINAYDMSIGAAKIFTQQNIERKIVKYTALKIAFAHDCMFHLYCCAGPVHSGFIQRLNH
jgi:hypothetical protein